MKERKKEGGKKERTKKERGKKYLEQHLDRSASAAVEFAEVPVVTMGRSVDAGPLARPVVVHPGRGVVKGDQVQPCVHVHVLRS